MDKELESLLESIFELRENEGADKVMSLKEAVSGHVRAGATLFLGWDAGAIVCEIMRQFWGKKPQFTIVATTFTNHALNLVHGGLVRRLLTSNCVYQYPGPRPSPIIQKAYRERTLEIENWSLYTFQQRLMAGAQGVGFMPTKSLIGSSMAEENKDSFMVIDDPFGSGKRLGLVKALNPDIALIHAWAADRYGNTITSPFSQDTLWGPKASKGGVVVSVEKIVSTDFIRAHSPLVRIPGHMVKAVVLAPFGAHPQGMTNRSLPEFEGYGEDYPFMLAYRKAAQDPQALDAWIREWVLDRSDHQDYLEKLGEDRLRLLKGRAEKEAWREQFASLSGGISTSEEYSPQEMMVVAGARKMMEKTKEKGYKLILAGIGASALAAWLAYYLLRKEGADINLTVGSGAYGGAPRPAEPILLSLLHVPTAKMLTDTVDMYGVLVCGENASCLSALGAGQIDKFGNINSIKLSEELYLTGSGGGNDNTSGAREVVAVAQQSRRRFVEKVPYVTCRGDRVTALASNLGVFEKVGEEFTLTAVYPDPTLSIEERARKVRENCGWELKVSPRPGEVPPPTLEELLILRMLDPERLFLEARE